MKCSNRVYHTPYIPLNRPGDALRPFICRLAPTSDGFDGEWFDRADAGSHMLYYSERGGDSPISVPLTSPTFSVRGLADGTEYALWVESASGVRCNVRLVRTGDAPENTTVINYLHPEDEQYAFSGRFLCSPSIARLSDGTLIAGMDVYGGRMAQNLMILFSSSDDGRTWQYLTDLYPFYWGSLFVHRGALYVLGLTTEYGNLQISRSTDGGKTWELPTILLYGSNVLCANGGMHRAPMHVVPYGGRLYTTCEYGCWAMHSHLPAVLSVDENADLMCADNWVYTGFLPFTGKWAAECTPQGNTMEGNVVLAPDGELYNILRWSKGKALVLKMDKTDPEASLEYVSLIDMPVSSSMFRILPYKSGYILVTNRLKPTSYPTPEEENPYRYMLSLYRSDDLRHWDFLTDLIDGSDLPPKLTGFQYPSPVLCGDTLYLTIRSAYNGADSFHNSNTILFTRVDLSKLI